MKWWHSYLNSWFGRIILPSEIKSYKSIRDSYRSTVSQRHSTLDGNSMYGNLKNFWSSLINKIRTSFSISSTLIFFIILDVIADFSTCVIYLVELQITNQLPFSVPTGFSQYFYIARPASILTMIYILSIYNTLVYALRVVISDNRLQTIVGLEGILNLVTCYPLLVIYNIKNTGQFIYIPYFLRAPLVVTRLKRALRLRGSLFSISALNEKIAILISTVIFLLYTFLCAFNYFELHFQPNLADGTLVYRSLTLNQSLYFIVM